MPPRAPVLTRHSVMPAARPDATVKVKPPPSQFWRNPDSFVDDEFPNKDFARDIVPDIVEQASGKKPPPHHTTFRKSPKKDVEKVSDKAAEEQEHAAESLKKLYADSEKTQGKNTVHWVQDMVMYLRDKLVSFISMLYSSSELSILDSFRRSNTGGFTGAMKGIAAGTWTGLVKMVRGAWNLTLSLLIWMLSSTKVWLGVSWALLQGKRMACQKFQIMQGNFEVISHLQKSREDGNNIFENAKTVLLMNYEKIVGLLPETVTNLFKPIVGLILSPFLLIPGVPDAAAVAAGIFPDLLELGVTEFIQYLRMRKGLDNMVLFFTESCEAPRLAHPRVRPNAKSEPTSWAAGFWESTKDFLGFNQEFIMDLIMNEDEMPDEVEKDFTMRTLWHKMEDEYRRNGREWFEKKYGSTKEIRDGLYG